MYSYKRTSPITKATWNEFYAFIGSIGKIQQFVAIWSKLPRSYDKVGQGVRHGTLGASHHDKMTMGGNDRDKMDLRLPST